MKLTELHQKDYAAKALKEQYNISFDTKNMSLIEVKSALKRVRNLAEEMKKTPSFYKNQTSQSYMKMVFMEQALVSRYNHLIQTQPRIVLENEEVEKSQVVLAAQDMVDSVQKMIEDVSDMLVKELPALSDSIQSEIGVNESQQFSSQVTEGLTALNTALGQAKTALQGALNVVTGQAGGGFEEPAAGEEMGGEMGAMPGAEGMGGEEPMPGAEPGVEGSEGMEEPEMAPAGGVGREKR